MYSESLPLATEPYGPDGRYGQSLTSLLVLIPVGWLLCAGVSDGGKQPAAGAQLDSAINSEECRLRPSSPFVVSP